MGPEKKRKGGGGVVGGEGTKFNSSKSKEKWNYEYNMIQNHWLQSSE